MTPSRVAVIDIGKTNAKLALVETEGLTEIAVLTRPNKVLPGPPYPHFDTEGHWAFLLDGLTEMQAHHGVDAIVTTTHGACAALLDAQGGLATPVLDYEHDGPVSLATEYDALRPDFSETGSPRVSGGLNLGAQLHWLFHRDPGLLARTATIVTWPQYWTFRLSGVSACDASSLGAHTDLWEPLAARPSTLVERLGLADKLAPIRRPNEVLGPILPEISARTGLAPGTPVLCGIHDSNASLYPHILTRQPPFSVVSTGTWVIVMTLEGEKIALDPARDTLINVDALGRPVPSARFMGGREHDLIGGGPAEAGVAAVLRNGTMLLPAVVPETGPFQGHPARWRPAEPPSGPERAAALAFYLALVTAECLGLTGHRGPIVVEGPFARNTTLLQMLAAATSAPVHASEGATGTSQGAALLALPSAPPLHSRATPPGGAAMRAYAAAWRDAL